MIPVLRDGQQRRISYLRLSITDRCDLRCRYCMPAEGEAFAPRSTLLTENEMLTVGRVAVGIGIRKIRVTGGEPLLHTNVVELLRSLRALPSLERLVVTTNGQRLARLAEPLCVAGVDGMNISIDSLKPDRYAEITRGGDLTRCLAGIDASLRAGFDTKLNVVIMRGVNDDEVLDFVQLACDRPLAVRFIEYMATRGDTPAGLTVPAAEVLERIARTHDLVASPKEPGGVPAGPAHIYRISDAPGTVGVITPVSEQFCSSCNRIRVSADGQARGCLFGDYPVDIRPYLAAGDYDGLARVLREIVRRKPPRHDLSLDGKPPGDDDLLSMSQVGG